MTVENATATGTASKPKQRYRMPGIEREGVAQLSLLETALWPLAGGPRPDNTFQSTYQFATAAGMKSATVTVRAPLGLQPFDELVLWGLLGATLQRFTDCSTLLATPYWMLKQLRSPIGGFAYDQLQQSLLRLAVASYHNTAFYNPETKEREQVAFQFLSFLLPTVGGVGESVDTARGWRVEWNASFLRFVRATGGNLLFDLDLYRELSPAGRRLFLKLKDRFWRKKRAMMNVDELTVQGLGFSAERSLAKRKYDLLRIIAELLDHRIIELGRGQTDPEQLIFRRSKGLYIASFFEGEYFRQPFSKRATTQKNAKLEHPLHEPLHTIGVDGPGIDRLFRDYKPSVIQRWVRVTDAALHEKPRGFRGFRSSPAAFLIDGVQNGRMPPDWFHEHEKRMERRQWERDRLTVRDTDDDFFQRYDLARKEALAAFLTSPEGRRTYDSTYSAMLALCHAHDTNSPEQAAQRMTRERIEEQSLQFPAFEDWRMRQDN